MNTIFCEVWRKKPPYPYYSITIRRRVVARTHTHTQSGGSVSWRRLRGTWWWHQIRRRRLMMMMILVIREGKNFQQAKQACACPAWGACLTWVWSCGRKLDENRVKVDKRPSSFTAAHSIDHSFLPMPFCLPLLLWYGFAQCSIYCFLMLACSTLRILITYEF